ncbi:LPXTG cell wall anchor domain-containing protein [Streptomyces sp.]|uniref:LPXTG cell wall anchor domain-containing protein n=1 Tax=Streptomyces sp. TaxID=1931 RepID=UPI002BF79B28|nr:LPXTG cell wall anchor domain-containing protein [Streptomyces sp.]HLL36067.1 LPXTG cell wall anchor domain-containing protein [Streptomyces sp.]HZF91257.1 LPXTG cell wall anchor domain-containing protein [Streptomyces sp.]
MRTLTRAGAVSAVAAAALLLSPAAHATPPGDNGTVKIHDAATGEELRKNEPHVCTFYLDAFGFDAGQQVDWHIESWAPTAGVKGETVKSGSLTLDGEGHGRTGDLSLPDGHYKLFWNFDGEKGAAKHKVFWTDCEEDKGGQPAATPSATPSQSSGASQAPSAAPSASAPAGAAGSGSAGASASAPAGGEAAPAGSSSPSAQGGGGAQGDLAETGSSAPVGLLAGIAAALVGAGGFLLTRRRRARQG